MNASRRQFVNPSPPPLEAISQLRTVKVLGIEWPCPPWALGFGAFLLLLALAASLTKTIVLPAIEDWQRHQEEQRIKSYAQRVVEEKAKHIDIGETPELKSLENLLTVRYYKSDGCLQVSRTSGLPEDQEWLFDLSRIKRAPAPGRLAENRSGALPWEGIAFAQVAPGSRCPNPHPGEFKQWNGERKECWLQVFRQWPDGCRQYQWYDSCYNVWDTNPDGSPKLYWEVCHH